MAFGLSSQCVNTDTQKCRNNNISHFKHSWVFFCFFFKCLHAVPLKTVLCIVERRVLFENFFSKNPDNGNADVNMYLIFESLNLSVWLYVHYEVCRCICIFIFLLNKNLTILCAFLWCWTQKQLTQKWEYTNMTIAQHFVSSMNIIWLTL